MEYHPVFLLTLAEMSSGWQDLFELQTANILAAFPCTMLCIL